MKRLVDMALLAILAASPAGFAASRPIILKASSPSGQHVRYDQGRQTLISNGAQSRAAVILSTSVIQPKKTVDLIVFAANDSDNKSFNFSTENIRASCNLKPIYVYRPEEALSDEQKRTDLQGSDLAGLSIADIQTLIPEMKRFYERRNQDLQGFAQNLLRAQTIDPKSSYGGLVRIAFPSCSGKLYFTISAGTDTHSFVFDILKK